MKYCAGHVKYLIAIDELLRSGRKVRCVDIAGKLGVSRASVSKMLRCLVNYGYVYDDFCNSVRLTDAGRKAVDDIRQVFGDIYVFFRRILKLPHDEAHRQAIMFVADFPEETCVKLRDAVRRTLDKKKTAE